MFRKPNGSSSEFVSIMGPRRNPNVKENLDCKQALYQAALFTLNPIAHDEDATRAEMIAAKQCFNEIFRNKTGR